MHQKLLIKKQCYFQKTTYFQSSLKLYVDKVYFGNFAIQGETYETS